MAKILAAVAAFTVPLLAVGPLGACGGSEATLLAIEVDPVAPAIAPGTTQQFAAFGLYDDGSEKALGDSISWRSSDEDVAEIDQHGLAVALGPGRTTITATLGELEGSAVFTVTSAELEELTIEGPRPAAPAGISVQLTAVGSFSDGSEQDLTSLAEWSSGSESVANVTGPGSVQTLRDGSAEIEASYGDFIATFDLSVSPAEVVSIEVQPAADAPISVRVGDTLELEASATLTDGETSDVTQSVTWSSDDPAAATVDPDTGVVTGVGEGQAEIVATLEGADGSVTGQLALAILPASTPSLVIPAGDHRFDTDSGGLTLEGQEPHVPEGWDEGDKRLELDSFTLEEDSVLTVTGSAPFRALALEDITIAGTLDTRGADGADGSAGAVDVPAGAGQDGAHGRSVVLIALSDLHVTGVIDARGGHGGAGGIVSGGDFPLGTLTGGAGGRGGDAGTVTLAAGGIFTDSGTVLRSGGNGGHGGDISVAKTLLTPSPTTSGRGGAGGSGSEGGHGGRGGDIFIGEAVNTPNTVVSGDGGAGGTGTTVAGDGGRGGDITVDFVNSPDVDMTAGNGGDGGFGDAQGGHGGRGGNIAVEGNAGVPVTAGNGGSGGDGTHAGGDGGDGGSVDAASGEPGVGGAGGPGGDPGGDPGDPGTP